MEQLVAVEVELPVGGMEMEMMAVEQAAEALMAGLAVPLVKVPAVVARLEARWAVGCTHSYRRRCLLRGHS